MPVPMKFQILIILVAVFSIVGFIVRSWFLIAVSLLILSLITWSMTDE